MILQLRGFGELSVLELAFIFTIFGAFLVFFGSYIMLRKYKANSRRKRFVKKQFVMEQALNDKLKWKKDARRVKDLGQTEAGQKKLWDSEQTEMGRKKIWNLGQAETGQKKVWNSEQTEIGQKRVWNSEQTEIGQEKVWDSEQTEAGQKKLWDLEQMETEQDKVAFDEKYIEEEHAGEVQNEKRGTAFPQGAERKRPVERREFARKYKDTARAEIFQENRRISHRREQLQRLEEGTALK